jgi:NitT/TauT family transport system substrate-binding protein
MGKHKLKLIPLSVTLVAVTLVIVLIRYSLLSRNVAEHFEGSRENIRIGLPREPIGSLLIVALDQDYFSAEGLDVTLVREYPSGKRAIGGLFDGDIDFTACAEVPVVLNSMRRQDFQFFATIGASANEVMIAARKDKGIHRPGDLRGKRIATQRGSAVHFFLHIFLLKYGLSEQDVTLSFLKAEELSDALFADNIDAFSMREPFIGQAKGLLGDNAVVFSEPGLYLKTFHVVAMQRFIQQKPERIRRIMRVLLRAERFVRENPDPAVKLVAEKLQLPESELETVWPQLNLQVSLDQGILSSLEDKARWAVKNEITDQKNIPNFLNYVYAEALKQVRPERVTIIE